MSEQDSSHAGIKTAVPATHVERVRHFQSRMRRSASLILTEDRFADSVIIDHLVGEHVAHGVSMRAKRKLALAVRCPTCGAKPGEKCELSSGMPRTDPHRDRRLAGAEK